MTADLDALTRDWLEKVEPDPAVLSAGCVLVQASDGTPRTLTELVQRARGDGAEPSELEVRASRALVAAGVWNEISAA